jgi:hypothetical protein
MILIQPTAEYRAELIGANPCGLTGDYDDPDLNWNDPSIQSKF